MKSSTFLLSVIFCTIVVVSSGGCNGGWGWGYPGLGFLSPLSYLNYGGLWGGWGRSFWCYFPYILFAGISASAVALAVGVAGGVILGGVGAVGGIAAVALKFSTIGAVLCLARFIEKTGILMDDHGHGWSPPVAVSPPVHSPQIVSHPPSLVSYKGGQNHGWSGSGKSSHYVTKSYKYPSGWTGSSPPVISYGSKGWSGSSGSSYRPVSSLYSYPSYSYPKYYHHHHPIGTGWSGINYYSEGTGGWKVASGNGWKVKVKWDRRRRRRSTENIQDFTTFNKNILIAMPTLEPRLDSSSSNVGIDQVNVPPVDEILSHDAQYGCGLRFVCELAATPQDQLGDDGKLILKLFGEDGYASKIQAKSTSTRGAGKRLAYSYAVLLGSKGKDLASCLKSYSKCPYSSGDIWKTLRG